MISHRSPISGVDAYAGRYVATAGYDNQVILWDAARKVSIARAFHDHLANQCRFSADGKFLVTASSDYTARLWELPSLRLKAVLSDHEDDVEMASMCRHSGRIATASRDHMVRIFDAGGGRPMRLQGHDADVLSVEWVGGGRELLSSSDDGTVRRWCALTGRLVETLDLGGAETDTVVVGERGAIYVGNDEGEVIAIRHGEAHRVQAHRAGIKRLLYEPTAGMLMSASYDRTFKLWSIGADDGSLCPTRTVEVPSCVWLRSCAFAGTSKLVFGTFGSSYATYDIERDAWDLDGVGHTPGLNAVRVVDGETYTVGDAGVVCRDGHRIASVGSLCNFIGELHRRVVTGGQMGTLFDAQTGRTLHQHRSPLNCSAVFRRGGEEHLMVGTYTGEGLVFRAGERDLFTHVLTLKLHDNAIKGIACTDEYIFSVCATGAAAFHRVDTLERAEFISDAHEKISNGAAALPDGRFVSVSRDLKLRIWSMTSRRDVVTPHAHSVKCVAASGRGELLATGAYDGTVALYNWRENVWVHTERPTASGISSLTCGVAPDTFIASSYDGQLYSISAG
ncbi:MAG: toxoflavin biosynthesis protein ToxC [Acidobacteriota bacterium]|jgi:WD40 repeat protein|nr:toxoflavin biosynthesis protein ToxC [Acidobacteriota bacterium]